VSVLLCIWSTAGMILTGESREKPVAASLFPPEIPQELPGLIRGEADVISPHVRFEIGV